MSALLNPLPVTAPVDPRPTCEVGAIFRRDGAAYRDRHALPLAHLRVMRAIEVCRPAA
jgi:hypothetical protein